MKYRLLLFLLIINCSVTLAQTDTTVLYKRFPTLPPLRLLMVDSSTVLTEKKLKKNIPVFLIMFSPDCDHCQKQTEELIDSIERFKSIQIIMATTLPFDKMKSFYKTYQLDRFKNITVGWDNHLILPTFYHMKSFPFLAFYNKKGNLIDVFEGALPLTRVLKIFREHS